MPGTRGEQRGRRRLLREGAAAQAYLHYHTPYRRLLRFVFLREGDGAEGYLDYQYQRAAYRLLLVVVLSRYFISSVDTCGRKRAGFCWVCQLRLDALRDWVVVVSGVTSRLLGVAPECAEIS
jgi:hypothetical protein